MNEFTLGCPSDEGTLVRSIRCCKASRCPFDEAAKGAGTAILGRGTMPRTLFTKIVRTLLGRTRWLFPRPFCKLLRL
jgi:hypothetical protein